MDIRILSVFLRILVFAVISLAASPVFAVEAAAGFAAVEEGDDQTRPAASLHMGWDGFYASRLYVWGRSYGPVTERTIILSSFRRFGLFGSKAISGSIGGAFLNEYTKVEYGDQSIDADFKAEEHNYNLGAQFGLSATLVNSGALHMSMNWDSHVFLAGAGGLFLASGRKQALGVLLGINF